MIQNPQQYELAEEAILKMKRFLLAAKQTHSPAAYAALSTPILLELQERERDVLIYLSEPVSKAVSNLTPQE
jgi:hypothetical protein